MKTSSSSIASVVLVAFGGLLVLPCFSFKSYYQELNDYLVGQTNSTDFEANLVHVMDIERKYPGYEQRPGDFRRLATAFKLLHGGDDISKLCDIKGLESLVQLIEAADVNAERLNHLTSERKRKVFDTCFSCLQSEWNKFEERESFVIVNYKYNSVVKYLNATKDDVFECIYHPRHTSKSTTRMDYETCETLIFHALLAGENNLASRKVTLDQFKSDVSRDLSRVCSLLYYKNFSGKVLEPAYELLKLKSLDIPVEQKLPELQGGQELADLEREQELRDRGQSLLRIWFLPTYLICKNFILETRELEKLTTNFYERLYGGREEAKQGCWSRLFCN